MQGELATTLTELQVVKGVHTATFDHLKRQSNTARAAEAVVQKRMNFNLQDGIQTVFDEANQRTKAYQFNVEGDI